MPVTPAKPSFLRAMSQIRALGAWTWHWLRQGEVGALDRNKAFDVAYAKQQLRKITTELESAGLTREIAQIDALNTATENLLSRLQSTELPSPLVIQRVVTVIESVQVSLLHTLTRKLNDREMHETIREQLSIANDAAITAIAESGLAADAADAPSWEAVEKEIAALEHHVSSAHQLLARTEINALDATRVERAQDGSA